MTGDPGLAPHPWVSIELRGGAVCVDGTPIPAPGAAEDRYLAALQWVAEQVAAPVGRRVGVTVTGSGGVVRHLAIHPDGKAEAIEDLVRAAAEPVRPPAPTARAGAHVTRRRSLLRRPVGGAITTALVIALAITGAVAISAAADRLPRAERVDPSAGEDASVGVVDASATPTPAVTHRARPRPALVADVEARGRGGIRVLVGATDTGIRAMVRVRPGGGAPVVTRRVMLGRGITALEITGLAGGRATWRISAPGARPLSGEVRVRPVITMTPSMSAPVSPAPPSPTPTRSGGGRGSSGGGQAAPVIPIDPDDQ